MQDATEFGKIIRGLMAANNLQQGKLAEELRVSPAILSNYITGKNIPEMDFLAKCVKKFELKNEGLADFLYKAFLSSATHNQKIVVDTRFINVTRFEMLSKILAVFMLYPEIQYSQKENEMIQELDNMINVYYNALEKTTKFHPPAD